MTVNTTRKIVAVSDLHERWLQVQIPKCDLMIVAGDITFAGDLTKIQDFNNWAFGLQDSGNVGEVVVIAGNHDRTAATDPETWRTLLPDVIYLQDEATEVLGLSIYGSPWSPSFFRQNWVFNADRGVEIRAHWQKIPENLDILVTHGPPYGIGDRVLRNYEHVGCHDLRETILAKKPRVHISGHIHSGYGMGMLGTTFCINASTCNESYQPVNPPVIFEI